MLDLNLQFDNQYAQLPALLYTKLPAEKVSSNPSLIHFNQLGCDLIGLDNKHFESEHVIQAIAGNQVINDSEPLAMVYSGHQFGVWAGQLGDGRALLLGQVRKQEKLWDIQLKGAGLTPYSRMGDGRAVMRSSIREYLCAEAMHALGIATTRSLCLLSINESVWREKQEPGAILARIAETHIRFGHFEHLYYNQLWDELRLLADHVIQLYFSQQGDSSLTYEQWFLEIVKRTAHMIAGWMSVGFCHGVMNTDNMSITGLTIDYGPYGFLENFVPNHICNHSDQAGRYAYNQQPAVGLWNLKALAHALQPILSLEQSEPLIAQYASFFEQHYDFLMSKKVGFKQPNKQSHQLWDELLKLLRESQADYQLAFSLLPSALNESSQWIQLFTAHSEDKLGNHEMAVQWLQKFKETHNIHDNNQQDDQLQALQHQLSRTNPTYVLRNWVAEAAIRAVEDDNDYQLLDEVLHCLQNPFIQQPNHQSKRADKNADYDFSQSAPSQFQNLVLSCSS